MTLIKETPLTTSLVLTMQKMRKFMKKKLRKVKNMKREKYMLMMKSTNMRKMTMKV